MFVSLAATTLMMVATPPAPTYPFDAYPAARTYTGRPGRLNLGKDRQARLFRTQLAQGLKKGVNFAGEYTLVGWGCGTQCLTYAVVHTRTGRVRGWFDACGAAVFRKDSRLVIINPSVDQGEPAVYPPTCPVDAGLLWDGKAFKELAAETKANGS